jgi:hypothetical protein
MRRSFLVILLQLCLQTGANVFADTVTLKDGSQIAGVFESGSTRSIQINVGGNSQTIAVDRIQPIHFDPEGSGFSAPPPPATSAAPQGITIPSGAEIAVRTIDRIDSKNADLNHEYAGSLDDPVVIDGVAVVPANANAVLRVTEIKNPRLGHATLSLTLAALVIDGQRIDVITENVDSRSGSHAKRAVVGGAAGAAAGAGIGALAGGAVGAGIGAGIGAGAGALGGLMTGKGVEIASETRFSYKLTQPVTIGYGESSR